MITGLSLVGDATAVVLRETGGGYEPMLQPIRGTYDRYGSIDGIEENPNTDEVLAYFKAKLDEGRFVVTESIDTIEDLLSAFERNCLSYDGLGPASATLDGMRIVLALIARQVWDALAPLEVAKEFVATHGLVWAPPYEESQRYPTEYGTQHGPTEWQEYLREAEQDFPALRAAFDAYVAEELSSLDGGFEASPGDGGRYGDDQTGDRADGDRDGAGADRLGDGAAGGYAQALRDAQAGTEDAIRATAIFGRSPGADG